jgi:hypothetical protein
MLYYPKSSSGPAYCDDSLFCSVKRRPGGDAESHKVIMRWLTENPEYEYVFMTDEDVAEFMCTTADHATLTAYDALKAGACRSVRLLVKNIYSHTGRLTLICPTAGFSAPSKHVGQTSGGSRSFTGTAGYMSTQTAGE